MSHTMYAAKFEQTIIHQHVHLRRESRSHANESQPMLKLKTHSGFHDLFLNRDHSPLLPFGDATVP
jgi:hypothetical protein